MNNEKPEQQPIGTGLQKNHDPANPMTLIEMALNKPDFNVETLEKLFALQERWEANQAKKAYLRAFADFQAKCPQIKKKKKVGYAPKDGGPDVSYRYAELSEIAESIKETLRETGLSYRWEIDETAEKMITCTCIVSHIDGHEKKTVTTAAKDTSGKKNDIQARGSTITYLQRYSLIGALGITTASEDNDAAGIKPKLEEKPKFEKLSTKELGDLVKSIGEAPNEPALMSWAAAQTERIRQDAGFRAAVQKKVNTFPKKQQPPKPAGR